MKLVQLKKIRKEKGLTQSEAATKCGISFSHYSKIEEGIKNPSIGVARKIAAMFEISTIDEILQTELSISH